MLLDTDFLIDLLRKNPQALERLEEFIKKPTDLYITHVTLWELYQGVYKSLKPEENLKKTEELVEFFEILPFTQSVDRRFGALVNELSKHGTPIGVMDTLIASIALENTFEIVTKNRKHFEKTGVQITEW
jgi:predicted nucleic acid-binding protein